MTRVFPEPAPAKTNKGLSMWQTAACWAGFNVGMGLKGYPIEAILRGMKARFVTKFFVLLVIGCAWVPPLLAQVTQIQLIQSQEAITVDQRLVGNVGAQAKREGVVVDLPQLFIYYRDFSPAYHISGFRPTMVDEIELVIGEHRIERSMVKLERLMERAVLPTDAPIALNDLPAAALYVVFYSSRGCEVCGRTREAIDGWIAQRNQPVTFIGVTVNPE
jgi:hypothetical protein